MQYCRLARALADTGVLKINAREIDVQILHAFGSGGLVAFICFSAATLVSCGGGGDRATAGVIAQPLESSSLKRPLAVAVPATTLSLETLVGVAVVDPSGTENGRPVTLMDDYVADRAAAIRLGKALFWDKNVGSDGQTACASCHSQAGADTRFKNTINPGLHHLDPHLAVQFTKPELAMSWGPNYTLSLADFPLHKLSDLLDRNSTIRSSTNDVIGSQGVFDAVFVQAGKNRFDDCTLMRDDIFHVGGLDTRRVTARNSPTVIGAVFNVRNFWDGRANNIFNGFSPFGNRDPDAFIYVASTDGSVSQARLALADASAASQAVGPPLNDFEMSCGGRTFPDIARRVLDAKILQGQVIANTDSVLAGWKNNSYRQLIQAAFKPRLWNGAGLVSLGGKEYPQVEANFPLFFGLAIQMYESTLVADQTPLDKYLNGDSAALGQAEVRGMKIFTGKAQCINCHNGPELTSAATRLRLMPQERVERMLMGDEKVALYDNGFYNIGVRPTVEDVGVGGTDPWGTPLSFTRQYREKLDGKNVPDPFEVDACKFQMPVNQSSRCSPPDKGFRDAVDGSFKVPTLRNIALTGPYFHNGGQATLEQVVEFYNRGGDSRSHSLPSHDSNTSGLSPNPSNLDPDIKPLNLHPNEMADLVAFLKNALTDPRVAWEKAPFDHPSLTITNGHLGDEYSIPSSQTGKLRDAQDQTLKLPAVGKEGRTAKDGPLQPFHSGLK